MTNPELDWGKYSIKFDGIKKDLAARDLDLESEAETRFHIIDRLIRELLACEPGQIGVEKRTEVGIIDYLLRSGDTALVIEAKRIGSKLASPTRRKTFKLKGSFLGRSEMKVAIEQAAKYAESKKIPIVIATNGLCWCIFTLDAFRQGNGDAVVLFPFEYSEDAERLFNLLSSTGVSVLALEGFIEKQNPPPERRLLAIVQDSESRVDRNNVADHIAPALDNALYSEVFSSNPDYLRKCYVTTAARTKYDTTLEMHLVGMKPISIQPARKIRTHKGKEGLTELIEGAEPSAAPPVTLIIGQVGVGKSTYLKHFEFVSGRESLERKKAHWIYIDFEAMGSGGNVRSFIYEKLKSYLLDPSRKLDFDTTIRPAYKEQIEVLRRGPYALTAKDPVKFDETITSIISQDFEKTEPYVDKVLGYISQSNLCVIVLDNVDLYPQGELERSALSEGLGLSKRLRCHIVVSIRDTTFINYKDDPMFNAFEFRKFWLDPPPFKEVLSRRLSLSEVILRNHPADLTFSNGMHLRVPNLGVFFEITQRSLLSGYSGEFIDAFANRNIRRGLTLVKNFLTSGHVRADEALKAFVTHDDRGWKFPFQEVFKGAVLGQWKYFKENRLGECINIYDSRLNFRTLRLLRLYLINFLYERAKNERTAIVQIQDCIELFSRLGVSSQQILDVLDGLMSAGLIGDKTGKIQNSPASEVFLSKLGGYYTRRLAHRMPYIESCLYDTAIEDDDAWAGLAELTRQIEDEGRIVKRMEMRGERLLLFLNYLVKLEEENLAPSPELSEFAVMKRIRAMAMEEASEALAGAKRNYGQQ